MQNIIFSSLIHNAAHLVQIQSTFGAGIILLEIDFEDYTNGKYVLGVSLEVKVIGQGHLSA